MPTHSFENLRVWHRAREFKRAIYQLTDSEAFVRHLHVRDQLRNAAAAVPSNLAEGYGRFDPLDNARFVRIARASLLECENHIIDAFDRGLISEDALSNYRDQAATVLREVGAYEAYLQSPEARIQAERFKRKRQERRRARTRNPGHQEP